jgi:ParB-like chromosome segregation protein Spo0J
VPIKVRRRRTGDYELVWGHRRLYADELAGLSEISALVEDMVEEEGIGKDMGSQVLISLQTFQKG